MSTSLRASRPVGPKSSVDRLWAPSTVQTALCSPVPISFRPSPASWLRQSGSMPRWYAPTLPLVSWPAAALCADSDIKKIPQPRSDRIQYLNNLCLVEFHRMKSLHRVLQRYNIIDAARIYLITQRYIPFLIKDHRKINLR